MDRIIDMLEAVSIPSNIPQPNIESRIRQDEGKTFVWQIHDPVWGGTKKTVLEENDRFWAIYENFFSSCWYSLYGDDVTIVCSHGVLLARVSIVAYYLALFVGCFVLGLHEKHMCILLKVWKLLF